MKSFRPSMDLGLQVLENAPEEGSDAMEAINQPVAPEPTENEMVQ